MNTQRDTVAATLGLVLGVVAMVGLLFTDEFAHAASAEARGYDALFHVVASEPRVVGDLPATAGPATLLACSEVKQ
ncbi:hypothetical protein [uncultured Massilia sp.]|uniref:hypothetical protein n=1 Tax=uncultured Massilia sp. TaxID=169973 RepID=UPI0025CCBD57|nr:hypothetical protein [uncultured Massilia sp.]